MEKNISFVNNKINEEETDGTYTRSAGRSADLKRLKESPDFPPPETICVYLLECGDGSLYCGWTNDLPKRVSAHQSGKGSKYTRSHLPVRLAYYETAVSREAALRREAAIKKLSHKEKLELIEQQHRPF